MLMSGVVVGIVTNLNDPRGEGRILVRFPWMAGEQESAWAPLAVPLAGPQRGAFVLPELQDEALVAFDRGDFNHPYVIGFLWNGVDTPPESDPKNRVILTPGGHTLRFEDGDSKKVILRTNAGHELLLDDSAAGNMIRVKTAGQLTLTLDDKDQSIQMQGGGRILALRGGQVQIS